MTEFFSRASWRSCSPAFSARRCAREWVQCRYLPDGLTPPSRCRYRAQATLCREPTVADRAGSAAMARPWPIARTAYKPRSASTRKSRVAHDYRRSWRDRITQVRGSVQPRHRRRGRELPHPRAERVPLRPAAGGHHGPGSAIRRCGKANRRRRRSRPRQEPRGDRQRRDRRAGNIAGHVHAKLQQPSARDVCQCELGSVSARSSRASAPSHADSSRSTAAT